MKKKGRGGPTPTGMPPIKKAAVASAAGSRPRRSADQVPGSGEQEMQAGRTPTQVGGAPRPRGQGVHLFNRGEAPAPDISMLKLLDSGKSESDFLEMSDLPAERQRSLRHWFETLRLKNRKDKDENQHFWRWWYNGAEANTKCLGCKVITKVDTKWDGNYACPSCSGGKTKDKRPCFRLYDRRDDDGGLVREVHVLPARGHEGVKAFGYFNAQGQPEA